MPERLALLALEPDHPTHNFRIACTLAGLHRPFAVGRPYLERLLRGDDRERYLGLIRTSCDLFRWRCEPAFTAWLASYDRPAPRGTKRSRTRT
jgi:hypothetical protein